MAEFLITLYALFWNFSNVFTHVFVINTLVSKTRVKTQEKRRKLPSENIFSILHYALDNNVSQLRLVLAFWNI